MCPKINIMVTVVKMVFCLLLNYQLPFSDAELNYNADLNDCVEKLSNVSSPFPMDVFRQKDFLQIAVNFNGTFEIYETSSAGLEICKITYTNSTTKLSTASKSLEEIYPECVR